MTPLIVVLGVAGAILILAGLIGGGFTFSGSYVPSFSVPKVGNWVRLPCFSVGAVLVVLAMVLGLAYNPLPIHIKNAADSSPASRSNAAVHAPVHTPPPVSTSPPPASTSPALANPSPPATKSQSADPSPPPANPSPSPTTTPPTPAPADTSTSPPIAWGTIVTPQGYSTIYVRAQPYTSSSIVAEEYDGASVGIVCTAQGDVMTNPDTGFSSSLWDDTSDGFIPDAYVDTGTNQATMPSC